MITIWLQFTWDFLSHDLTMIKLSDYMQVCSVSSKYEILLLNK